MKKFVLIALVVFAVMAAYWTWPGDQPGMWCGYINGNYQCYSKG